MSMSQNTQPYLIVSKISSLMPMPLLQDIPWKLTLFQIESSYTLTIRNVFIMFPMCCPKNIFLQDILYAFL